MKKAIFIIPLLLLFAAGCNQAGNTAQLPGGQIACTQEAKICPDGSTVSRIGPNCEFAACPAPNTSTTTIPKATSTKDQGYCTQDVKVCPDGSYVGRIPPKCEFVECPSPANKPPLPPLGITTGVHIVVTLGPTCPVQRIPPDPGCADKPYEAIVEIHRASDNSLVTKGEGSDLRFVLEPGEYSAVPVQTQMLPRGSVQNFTVEPNKVTEVQMQFDTGIR